VPKPRIQSRVDESQKSRIETFADVNDMTQAEAVRYLTFRGLDYEEGKLSDSSGSDADPVAERNRDLSASARRWGRNGLLFAVVALALIPISQAAPVFAATSWSVAGALTSVASLASFLLAVYSGVRRLLLLTAAYDMTVAEAFRAVVFADSVDTEATAE
jgi:hypothetical protein